MSKTRVVILGGGFAGVAAARALEHAGRARVDVTLVSRENFMLFTPMLPEVAAGSIEAGDVMQPLRADIRSHGRSGSSLTFELGEAIALDPERRTVTVRHPITHESRALQYDELVFAVGATASTMGVPGVERFAVPLKTLADAQVIRSRAIGALEVAAETKNLIERDRLLRFVIVGGNFTGIELAGELQAFLASVLRYYPTIDPRSVELVLLDSAHKLMEHLPEKFGKYAAQVLSARGTRIRLNEHAAAVDARGIELKDGERIASATVLWAAGERPSPLAEQLGLKTDKRGAIETGGDFAIAGTPHLWAVGDCAAVPTPHGGTYAPLAQNAVREGPLLARNILARVRGRATRNFRYREMGQMASLGNRKALVELPGGRMLTGLPAWLLWRSYYLGHVPGLARKAHVAADWTIGLVFPPQIARLPMAEKGETSFERSAESREKLGAVGR